MKLNLGCGNRILPNYINIDNMKLEFKTGNFLNINVFDLPKYFKSNSIHEIRASHFFEHLTHSQIIKLLYICWDLLIPKGILHIIVPDFYSIMEIYQLKAQKRDFKDIDLLHIKIFNEEDETVHRSIWSKDIAKYYLEREGFYKIEVMRNLSEIELEFNCIKI